MTAEDRDRIYSNDYADLIINYSGDTSVLERYKNYLVQIINYYYAVVHIPASQLTDDFISRMGYAILPSILGLISSLSLEASGVFRLRNVPAFNLRGKGVLIGFVDSGIDYTNPVFQYSDKTTKISSIWDQTIDSDQIPIGMNYGTEYTREQINEALISDDPLSVVPSKDEVGHGTMLAGIAAGNEVPESGFYGVAPDAELVVVKLKPAKQNMKAFFRVPENVNCYQENDRLTGYQYLFNVANQLNKPLVICSAIDTSLYAHDGRGSTGLWLSAKANDIGIAVITAVGNEGNARRHYFGTINPVTGYDTVELNVGPNESGFSMEIWGAAPNIYSVDITTPSGEYFPRVNVSLQETIQATFIFEPTVIIIDYVLVEAQSGEQLILLRFTNPTEGIWKFNVYGRGVGTMNFHIWLPMSGFITNGTFFMKSNPYTTLLSLSCAENPISVTAYNIEDDSLYIEAGRGYTRTDSIKPNIAAPGVNILAPSTDNGFIMTTGTSAAAAHTAGIAAMLLEWGIVQGKYPRMSTVDIKIFMIRGARRDISITYPNRDWGYGILDIFNVFDSLRREV